MERPKNGNNYILHLGSYPPRECGIATFTQDLVTALNKKYNPVVKTRIAALNDQPTSIYNYNSQVHHQIAATELGEYVDLARDINKRDDVKLVNIQHEFGLFGGEWGDYLIPFLQVLEKPAVITFHAVLSLPSESEEREKIRNVVRSIAALSKALVVMNKLSQEILEKEYEIPKYKIILIPHGIPQIPFESSEKAKKELELVGRTVLSTFGMLSINKGVEHAIRALPPVAERFPDILYLIIGATHPQIRKKEGEEYRNFLVSEVERLGLQNHVKFYNKYLTLDEIVQYLRATDVYIATTTEARQSVSGTLSYALGAGRPIISTPTAYAKYIIDKSNGYLVKFRKHREITTALLELLADEKRMKSMSTAAYEKSRQMIWPNVATQYFSLYKKFADLEAEENKLPDIKFDHLVRLTDNFGVIHHAKYSKPAKRYGYSLDDNARALIACIRYYKMKPAPELLDLMKIYLKFIKFAQRSSGNFANIVSYRRSRDATVDEDVFGRALWALGYTASQDFLPKELSDEAQRLFMKATRWFKRVKSPRAIAFTLAGLYFYLKRFPKAVLYKVFTRLADRQFSFYNRYSSEDWNWFEDQLTYSNSKLPESLFYAYDLTKNKKYLKIAETTLGFLRQITFLKNYYAPIGQNGWYSRYQKRSYFDQQPEDTASMVEAKVTAYKVTGDKNHLDDALGAFQWFLGKNHLKQMVYDEVTGGCNDGVGASGINLNQGAESSISYLLARLALEEVVAKDMSEAGKAEHKS